MTRFPISTLAVIAVLGAAVAPVLVRGSTSAGDSEMALTVTSTATAPASDACQLLTPADILKATGLKVGTGTTGKPVPGVLGRCTWTGSGNTKVIVTLADAPHMETTIAAQQQSGGTAVPGLGSKAVGINGAAFSGGGYIVSVLDGKGGFGVSILGQDGTRDRAVALAKIVQSRR